jgi:hypothetical protein
MQIQLKQAEIIEGLKQYIAKKGISLIGKEVTVTFTKGHKGAGVSAEVTIDDTDMPEFGETPKPVLSVVKALPMTTLVTEEAQAPEETTKAAEPAATVAETPGKSLFS